MPPANPQVWTAARLHYRSVSSHHRPWQFTEDQCRQNLATGTAVVSYIAVTF